MGCFPWLLQRGLGFTVGGPQVVAVSREQTGKAVSMPVGGQCSRQAACPVEAQEEASKLSGLLTFPSLRNLGDVGLLALSLFPPPRPPRESRDHYQTKLFPGPAILTLTLRLLSSP